MCRVVSRRRRFRSGADDPAPERGEIALLGVEAAIDEIPAHSLGHAECKRRHQPAGGEVVVDIGADTHRDPEPVARCLQRLAVELEFWPARGQPRHAGGLQPGRPVVGRMRDPDQAWALQVGGALQAVGEPRGAHRHQVGREQRLGDEARPLAVAELDAAAPVVGERHRHAAGRDPHLDVGLGFAELGEMRDHPLHREGRADADGEDACARRRRDLRGEARQRVEDRRQPALIGAAGRRGDEAVRLALEQRDAEPLLQQVHHPADRGG